MKRVKDAKVEAQREIEGYKRQKEEEFKKFEAEVCLRNPYAAIPLLMIDTSA